MSNNTARHAADAAAAIREINHGTFGREALPFPPQVSEVAQPLAVMVDRLPQTFDQLSAAVRRHLSAGLIRMDDGTEPDQAAKEVLQHLGDAQDSVRALSDSLHKGAAVLFHMGTAETEA
ncbi:hypothetical protein [Streptomyces sp. GS7]|uniref:hypothetical protein n=1 Tax=Streptomyces sp. GS7 TaxID=2692234 RepID=UPI0013170DF0|nr:hypothetical protein [Streptomyces sp. GS7]QHC26403.1 hypothetical protein GR130_38575 [Streptomyces sp. GS7]